MPWEDITGNRSPLMRIRFLVIAASCFCFEICSTLDDSNGEFKTLNVARLSTIKHGSEIVFLENNFHSRRSYKLEDFFWTGSGDGPDDDDSQPKTSTVYETKTVLSTIYTDSPMTAANGTTSRPPKCVINCSPTPKPDGEINPTGVYPEYENITDEEPTEADRQFWLLTVLRADGKDPVLVDLKNNLAKLYRRAFQRQQEKHLGIEKRTKRNAKPTDKPVKVFIHNVAKSPINGDRKIEVLYHVAVSGQPVPASTAAEDMSLISDEEVIKELGYPFLIKAEPYLKPSEPLGLSTSKNTWLFIGSSLAAVFILLLGVAFLSLCITKSKKKTMVNDNMRQVYEHGPGKDNGAFVEEDGRRQRNVKKAESPTYIDFRAQTSNETLRSVDVNRSQSSLSSSTVSSSSLDISPLMGLRKHRTPPKKTLRPKGATNKTVPMVISRYKVPLADSDTSSDGTRRNSPDTVLMESFDTGVVSPKSYLSMPSVKSFPRCNIPEPLSKVLEPVSVLHLDMADDTIEQYDDYDGMNKRNKLLRHGSVGTSEDPGVIGPVVWNMHCQRLQHGVSVDEGMDEMKIASNVTRMRKRFHDLLDDTFSLFGSRRESPEIDESRPTPSEVKSHSAVNRASDDIYPTVRPRPKTSDPRRPPTAPSEQPRGAWDSHAPSPLIRPLSAGILSRPLNLAPRVDVAHVLAEGHMSSNDPAIPLIAAIKSEIGKCSLPGSTTNLIGD